MYIFESSQHALKVVLLNYETMKTLQDQIAECYLQKVKAILFK